MSNKERTIRIKRKRRSNRTRAKIFGTKNKPRLTVFRSLRHISVQLIDDVSSKTLAAASSLKLGKTADKKNNAEIAFMVGEQIAKKANELKIKQVVFDRSRYKYHGRVKSLADGARKGGIKF